MIRWPLMVDKSRRERSIRERQIQENRNQQRRKNIFFKIIKNLPLQVSKIKRYISETKRNY